MLSSVYTYPTLQFPLFLNIFPFSFHFFFLQLRWQFTISTDVQSFLPSSLVQQLSAWPPLSSSGDTGTWPSGECRRSFGNISRGPCRSTGCTSVQYVYWPFFYQNGCSQCWNLGQYVKIGQVHPPGYWYPWCTFPRSLAFNFVMSTYRIYKILIPIRGSISWLYRSGIHPCIKISEQKMCFPMITYGIQHLYTGLLTMMSVFWWFHIHFSL